MSVDECPKCHKSYDPTDPNCTDPHTCPVSESPFQAETAATAFGCFQHHHSSHPDAASAWQCIREHFALLQAIADAALAKPENHMQWMHNLCAATDAYKEATDA